MKKLHFTLRPAMPEDRNFLYQLKKEVNLGYISAIWGWDEDYQQEEFDRDFQKREEFSVIVSDDADAGFLQLQRGADFLNVAEIHLLPAFRGQGLGTAVLRYIQALGDKEELPVLIGCFRANQGARDLYLRLGFQPAGESDTHYLFLYYPTKLPQEER